MGVENRLTDRKKLTAALASDNLVFYVVDKADISEHPDGSSFQVSKEDIKSILGLDLLLNEKFLENPSYDDIAAMLADQANQTPGKVQHVTDATSDITVAEGYAYYEYLGPATESLGNYRKLSQSEASLLQKNTVLNSFKVDQVYQGAIYDVPVGSVSFEYAGNDVNGIVFDKVFSLFLNAYSNLIASHDIEVVLFNRTKQKTLTTEVIGFNYTTVDNEYYKTSLKSPAILDTDVSSGDTIDVLISISKKPTGLFKIGDYMVDRRGGSNTTEIKAGNIFQGVGNLSPTEFIHGIALIDNPAPADINDETKVKLWTQYLL